MFKKLFDELINAKTAEEVHHILYRLKSDSEDWGVDLAFQHEKLNWQDHERLFNLAEIVERALKNG